MIPSAADAGRPRSAGDAASAPDGRGAAQAPAKRRGPVPPLPALPFAGDAPPCVTEPCSQCCHDIEMILTEADLARLQSLEAAERATGRPFPEDWWSEAEDGFMQLHVRDAPPARGSPGGRPCVFLGDDGRCTVWHERPEGCRLYPAVWDDALREAVLDDVYCPHTEGFRLVPQMSDATRRLASRLHAERAERQRRAGRPPSKR